MNSLKIKYLKKICFFLVSEYGNLTGVKTYRDRLENSGEDTLEKRVQIFGFGKGRGPHRGFGCCPVIAFSFFCLLRPWDFKNFLVSALNRPFQVFTLESHFYFFFFFHSFFFTVLLCTWQFKIHHEQVKDWSRFFVGRGKETTTLLIMKNFLRNKTLQSKYLRSIKMDF